MNLENLNKNIQKTVKHGLREAEAVHDEVQRVIQDIVSNVVPRIEAAKKKKKQRLKDKINNLKTETAADEKEAVEENGDDDIPFLSDGRKARISRPRPVKDIEDIECSDFEVPIIGQSRWSKYKTVRGTQKFHEFKAHPTDKQKILCSFTSSNDNPIPKKFFK